MPSTTTIVSSSSSSPGEDDTIIAPRLSGLHLLSFQFEAGFSGPYMNEFMQGPPPERSSSPHLPNKTTSGSEHSSASKRPRSPVPEPSQRTNRPSTGGRRKKTDGIYESVVEMVQLSKEKFDLVRQMYNKDAEARRPIPAIEDCMMRIYNLQGLTSDQVLAAADALKDVQNRQLFMTMNDDLAYKWVERQIAKENMMFRQFFPGP